MRGRSEAVGDDDARGHQGGVRHPLDPLTAHYVVRTEDWPVMPVTTVGFKLRADGFFDGDPALDVPPAQHRQHQG